jgi:hypothetical protein
MLLKLGGLAVDARGSIGGMTISRNRSGLYARARVTPVNPKTILQSGIRSIIASVSQAWRTGTTAAQKAAWAIYAANVAAKNKLGDVIYLSGFNQYVKSNVVALNAGLAAIADAPSVFTLPGEDPTFEIVASEAAQTLACTFDATADWAGEEGGGLVVRMGLPQGDSITFFDGPFRHAGMIAGDETTAPTTGDTVPCPYPIVAGQKIYAEAKIIMADGRVSDWFRSTVLGVA